MKDLPSPAPQGRAVYFDITTSAHWSGRAVGIVRVERELARRGPGIVGQSFSYCVYDRAGNVFHAISPEDAREILSGNLQIDFGTPPPPPPPPPPPTGVDRLRASLRGALRRSRTIFVISQRIRGRRFTSAQVDEIMAGRTVMPLGYVPPLPDWVDPAANAKKDGPRRVYLADCSRGAVRLSPSVTIVSAGLDWEHKDLRSIYQLKKTTPFRYVVVLYDLIPLLLPHFVVPAYVDLLTAYFGELFWTADACIAISKTTEQDGQAYIALNQLQTPPRLSNFVLGSDLPVVVGGDSAEESLPPQLNGVQFALYVSTVEPRKNHRTLYHAWQVAIRNGWIDPKTQKLVFVGHSGWNVGDLLYELDANPALEGSIIRLQGVSDELLDRLYRDAAFCLMPSRYEGYGLPLAESLRYGKPCLSTSAGALCEVGGSLVTYLDPDDVFAWAESVSQWFKSPGLLSDMSTKIRASYNPTGWSASAEEFYRQVLEEPRK